MIRMAVLTAALATAVFAVPAAAPAGETGDGAAPGLRLAQRAGDGLPKGSYQQSCQCQLSGGLTLVCYCANINGRLFQTTMDVRSCQAPKDIRNCDGTLKCTDKGQEC